MPAGAEVSSPSAAAATAGASPLPCIGTGTDGNRVQAIYAHPADVADRYDTVAPTIRDAAAQVDQVFMDSAAETGGSRRVRWVTDTSCNLVIERVQLSASGDDSINNTQAELQALGFNRTDRKYLIWMDSNIYCGIGTILGDDQPGQANLNNSGPSYSRVDSPCWDLSTPIEAHELMHNLGGVQPGAPHATRSWHCSDDFDRMCYQDDASVVMTYPCPTSHERLFDCNHDDYFSTTPAPGSYLAGHWNTAGSSFLIDPNAPPPPPTSTTTTLPPVSKTSTWSGSLSKKVPSKSYDISMRSGWVSLTLTFAKAPSMTATVLGSGGTVYGQYTGPSALTLGVFVPTGTNRVTVSTGGSTVNYSLSVSYQS